jgi:hypothetical protein
MKILEWRRGQEPPTANGFCTLASFDVEIVEGVRLYGLEAVRAPDGKVLVYAPTTTAPSSKTAPRRSATFRRDVGDALSAAIIEKLGVGHDRHADAA